MNENNKNNSGRINVAQGSYPFTKYKIAEIIVCAAAVAAGLLYLYTDLVGLSILLPVFSLIFAAVTLLRYMDTKRLGGHGFAAYLPVFCWGFLSLCVLLATVVYFIWY